LQRWQSGGARLPQLLLLQQALLLLLRPLQALQLLPLNRIRV
jgi:hypothetical protein